MEECIHSKVARESGIDNTPSPEIEAHITESVESLLDPLREAWEACSRKQGWGTPAIRISSGYRCRELNRAVGGSVTSAHRYGYAFRPDSAERTDEGIQGVLPGVSEGAGF